MSEGLRLLNIDRLPVAALWAIALAGLAIIAGTLFWIMPAPLRRGSGGRSVAAGAVAFIVMVALLGHPRAALWFGGVGFTLSSLPLLWMGRLPADMPDSRDPAIHQYPGYPQIRRRGRIAGAAIGVLVLVTLIGSSLLVAGIWAA